MKYLPVLFLFQCFLSQAQNNFTSLSLAFDQLAKEESYQHANISFCLIDSSNGKMLFQRNKDQALAPASTLKTFTTASALNLLGSDFRFKTKVSFKGSIKQKVGIGELIIFASGDPSFGSDRFKETSAEQIKKNILLALKKHGMETFKGKIRIESKAFQDEPINSAWLDEDIGNYYGAGIYNLNWRENKFEINMVPTANSFEVSSNSAAYDNKTSFCIELQHKDGATTEEAFAFVEKHKPCMYVIRGVLSNKNKISNMQLARLQPEQDFKNELTEYLVKEMHFEEMPIVNNLEKEKQLVELLSPPLSQLVYWCNQKSLNLYAEALCKKMAVHLFHKGTWPLGTAAMIRYANSLGIDTKSVNLKDGSGLAVENKVTTYVLAQLLQKYTSASWFSVFYQSLPSINGLIMKSGYIGGTRSYAGYIKLKDGKHACFSFIINNYSCTPKEVKTKMFQLLDLLK